MTNKLIIATPKFSAKDLQYIQSLRQRYDQRSYAFIEPHFTFAKPKQVASEKLKQLLHKNIQQCQCISFILQTAIVMPPFNGHSSWYAFLMPEQGFSALSDLYYKIYSAELHSQRDYNFPFLPHLTVGSFTNKADCIALVEKLNSEAVCISGWLDCVTLLEENLGCIKMIEKIYLR